MQILMAYQDNCQNISLMPAKFALSIALSEFSANILFWAIIENEKSRQKQSAVCFSRDIFHIILFFSESDQYPQYQFLLLWPWCGKTANLGWAAVFQPRSATDRPCFSFSPSAPPVVPFGEFPELIDMFAGFAVCVVVFVWAKPVDKIALRNHILL